MIYDERIIGEATVQSVPVVISRGTQWCMLTSVANCRTMSSAILNAVAVASRTDVRACYLLPATAERRRLASTTSTLMMMMTSAWLVQFIAGHSRR